jgi:cell division protein FtsX
MKFEKDWFLSFLLVFLSGFIIGLFGFLLLFFINLDSIITNLASDAFAYAYLKEGVDGIEEIKAKILEVEGVSSVSFIPPEVALKELEQTIGEEISISELFGHNPLPGAFQIWFSNFNDIKKCISKISDMGEIEGVDYPKRIFLLLGWLIKISKNPILWIATLFPIAALIFVLVKLDIYNREEEIGVFKQLGAPTLFVLLPNLLYGGMIGLTGGCIGILGLWLLYKAISLHFIFLSTKLVALLLLGSGLIGVSCSLLSILPFLRRSFELIE